MGENGDIFAVSRFYDDTYSSFIDGSVKSTGGSFEWLNTEVSLYPFIRAILLKIA